MDKGSLSQPRTETREGCLEEMTHSQSELVVRKLLNEILATVTFSEPGVSWDKLMTVLRTQRRLNIGHPSYSTVPQEQTETEIGDTVGHFRANIVKIICNLQLKGIFRNTSQRTSSPRVQEIIGNFESSMNSERSVSRTAFDGRKVGNVGCSTEIPENPSKNISTDSINITEKQDKDIDNLFLLLPEVRKQDAFNHAGNEFMPKNTVSYILGQLSPGKAKIKRRETNTNDYRITSVQDGVTVLTYHQFRNCIVSNKTPETPRKNESISEFESKCANTSLSIDNDSSPDDENVLVDHGTYRKEKCANTSEIIDSDSSRDYENVSVDCGTYPTETFSEDNGYSSTEQTKHSNSVTCLQQINDQESNYTPPFLKVIETSTGMVCNSKTDLYGQNKTLDKTDEQQNSNSAQYLKTMVGNVDEQPADITLANGHYAIREENLSDLLQMEEENSETCTNMPCDAILPGQREMVNQILEKNNPALSVPQTNVRPENINESDTQIEGLEQSRLATDAELSDRIFEGLEQQLSGLASDAEISDDIFQGLEQQFCRLAEDAEISADICQGLEQQLSGLPSDVVINDNVTMGEIIDVNAYNSVFNEEDGTNNFSSSGDQNDIAGMMFFHFPIGQTQREMNGDGRNVEILEFNWINASDLTNLPLETLGTPEDESQAVGSLYDWGFGPSGTTIDNRDSNVQQDTSVILMDRVSDGTGNRDEQMHDDSFEKVDDHESGIVKNTSEPLTIFDEIQATIGISENSEGTYTIPERSCSVSDHFMIVELKDHTQGAFEGSVKGIYAADASQEEGLKIDEVSFESSDKFTNKKAYWSSVGLIVEDISDPNALPKPKDETLSETFSLDEVSSCGEPNSSQRLAVSSSASSTGVGLSQPESQHQELGEVTEEENTGVSPKGNESKNVRSQFGSFFKYVRRILHIPKKH